MEFQFLMLSILDENYLVLSDVGDAVINIIEKRHTYYSNNHPRFHINGTPLKEKILTKSFYCISQTS